MPGEGAGPKLATAYYELIPSMAGAEGQISSGLLPATGRAGLAGGASIGAGLLGGLKKFAGPIAILAAGFSVKKIVSESMVAFDGLAQTTRTLQLYVGGTADQVSGLAGAMQLAGLDTTKSQTALTIFSKNLGNASTDAAKTSAMTKLLGTDFRDAAGNVKPMSDILPGLADKFQSMPDGAQKTALALSLFGRAGAQMIPFLDQGSAGLAKLTAQAKASGLVISESAETDWWKAQLAAKAYSASVTGAKAALGQDLAPVLESVASIGRSVMTPVLNGMTSALNTLMPKFLSGASVIQGWADKAGGAVKNFMSGFTSGTVAVGESQSRFSAFGNAVHGIFLQIGAVVGPVMAAFKPLFAQLEPVFASLIPQVLALFSALSPTQLIFKALLPVLPQLVGVVGKLAASLGGALGSALTAILPPVSKIVSMLAGDLSKAIVMLLPIITDLAKPVATYLGTYWSTAANFIGQVVKVLGPVLGSVLKQLMPVIAQIAGVFGQVLKALMPLVPALMPLVKAVLSLIVPLLSLIGPILKPLIGLFVAILKPILALVAPLVKLLVPVLTLVAGALSVVVGWITTALTWFVGLITGSKSVWKGINEAWGGLTGFFNDMWTNIGKFFTTGINTIIGFFTSLPGKVLGALAGAGNWLVDVGRNMIQGLLNGAGSLLKNIGSFFLKIVPSWILGPFKAALGIHSPSTVMAEHGVNIGAGLIQGVQSTAGDVAAAMSSLVRVPPINTAAISGTAPTIAAAARRGANDSDAETTALLRAILTLLTEAAGALGLSKGTIAALADAIAQRTRVQSRTGVQA